MRIISLTHSLVSILIFLQLSSCNEYPSEVQTALDASGNNRVELEKVIKHYQDQQDDEKLKAAYFLISHMENKSTLDGKVVRNFDVFFDILDSLHRKKIKIPIHSPLVQAKWDSVVDLYGNPSLADPTIIRDIAVIKSNYLIENIDFAFEVRKDFNWGKELSFEHFCEFVLPYRIGNERLEPWRKHVFNSFRKFRDTTSSYSRYELAEAINKYLKTTINTNHALWSYPFDMPVSKMEKGKRGACKHVVFYTAAIMRANGLPVGIDYVNQWGTYGKGHEWNVILTTDGKFFPFDATRVPLGGIDKYPHKPAKVFRYTFATQKTDFPDAHSDIPPEMLNQYVCDVTQEYTKTYDIQVALNTKRNKSYAVICTFNNREWVPQDVGEADDNHAQFKNIGSEVAYLVMYYDDDGIFTPASDPFILEKNGDIRYLIPSAEKQDMFLLRKFPCFSATKTYQETLLGLRFQGANRADFRDSTKLYTITNAPSKLETAIIENPLKFRFVRAISANKKDANIAEIEFYGGDKKNDTIKLSGKVTGFPEGKSEHGTFWQNAFDGNLETYFKGHLDNTSWVGLALGKAKYITKIRYVGRSDTNFIIEGNVYELCIWLNGEWKSLGKQTADKSLLTYKNAPKNGLYLLHNLSKGKEERIFIYENGEQIWY